MILGIIGYGSDFRGKAFRGSDGVSYFPIHAMVCNNLMSRLIAVPSLVILSQPGHVYQ